MNTDILSVDLGARRRHIGIGQAEVALRASCSVAAVKLYERGYRARNGGLTERINKALDDAERGVPVPLTDADIAPMVEGIANFPERAVEWVALATRLANDKSRTETQRQVAGCWAAIISRVANGEDFIDVSRELDASNGGILYAPDGGEVAER
jgi:transcriptional regulator with XRE-family HTH domain